MEKSREVEKDHLKYVEDIRFQFKNYKSFPEETEIKLKPVTLIFGKNGSGKSAILEAIDLFFKSAGVKQNPDQNYLPAKNFALIVTKHTKTNPEEINFAISAKTKEIPFISEDFFKTNGFENKIQFEITFRKNEFGHRQQSFLNQFQIDLPFGKTKISLVPNLKDFLENSPRKWAIVHQNNEFRKDFNVFPIVKDQLIKTLLSDDSDTIHIEHHQYPYFDDQLQYENLKFAFRLFQKLKKELEELEIPFEEYLYKSYEGDYDINSLMVKKHFIFEKISKIISESQKIDMTLLSLEEPFFINPFIVSPSLSTFAESLTYPMERWRWEEKTNKYESLERGVRLGCKPRFPPSLKRVKNPLSFTTILEGLWKSESVLLKADRSELLSELKITDFVSKITSNGASKDSLFLKINEFLDRLVLPRIYFGSTETTRNYSSEIYTEDEIMAVMKGNVYKSILPIIASLFGNEKFILIQEPEQNLHPSLQSRLTEEIIREVREKNKFVIFETHSENVLYRVMRLAKEKKYGLNSEDVQIYYVEQDEKGVSHVIDLGLDQKNRFTGFWSKDFFQDKNDDIQTL